MRKINVFDITGMKVGEYFWSDEKVKLRIFTENSLDRGFLKTFYDSDDWFDPRTEDRRMDDAKHNFDDFLNKICRQLFDYGYRYTIE